MNDFDYDLDLNDEDDRRTYDTRYLTKLKELTGKMDTDSQDEVIDELKTMQYNPSNSPEVDCELNFLKSQNERKKKQHRFSKTEESFLQFQAQESGKSSAQVKSEARKFLKGVK